MAYRPQMTIHYDNYSFLHDFFLSSNINSKKSKNITFAPERRIQE